MAKPFKILLWIVGGFFALLAVTALAVSLLFNPNDYKGKITGSVKDSTGRELLINGDIKLTLFPWLGASVSNVVLGNAKGFGPEPFAQVADMNVGIKLMPLLFAHRVEIRKIHVDGLALNLTKAADGTTNWGDLSKNGKPEEPGQATPAGGHTSITGVSVGGLDIKNVAFSYTDKQAGSAYKMTQLSVQTGAIELDEPLDVTIAFLVNSTNPPLESDVKIAFTANANVDTKVYEIKDLELDSTTKGASVPGGSQKASVRASAQYDGGKGSFQLSDAVLEAAGLKVNAAFQGEGLSTDTPKVSGKLSSNTFSPKDVAKSFGVALPPTTDPAALTQASFATNLSSDTKSARLEGLTLKLDQTTATGSVTIADLAKQTIEFALKADSFDADRYLAPAGQGAAKDGGDKGKGDFKQTPIPIEALDAVNAHGTVELGSLTVKGAKMTAIKIVLNALKGQPKTEEMTALLYGGKINQSARFSHASPVHYDFKVGLDAINSAPMLKDVVGKSYLSGLGNFTLNASSGGTTVGAILQALSGTVGTSFKDGAIEGFNLDQTLSTAKALYSGQPAPAASGPARTEFKDLKAAGDIVNGVVNMKSLDMKGAWYQLGGAGKISLVDQTLDYTLLPTVSGDKYKDLQGTKIPVQVTGNWTDPKVKVDLAGVLKGRAQQELNKQEDKYREKAKDRIGDFLRKQFPAPAEQKPAERPKQDATPPPAK